MLTEKKGGVKGKTISHSRRHGLFALSCTHAHLVRRCDLAHWGGIALCGTACLCELCPQVADGAVRGLRGGLGLAVPLIHAHRDVGVLDRVALPVCAREVKKPK